MSEIPEDLKYSDTHEWVRDEGDGFVTVGITDHAQSLLGDLVFVELPENNIEIEAGEECGVVESVKAASDIYSPVTGKIVEINRTLEGSPDVVNTDPYGDGWLYRVKLEDEDELETLMDAEGYAECIEDEEDDDGSEDDE
jgi:glycine cleavage system H protein